MPGQHDIFLSYSSRDKEIAQRLYEYLSAENYDVWLDKMRLMTGDNVVENVFEAISNCRYFAILLTRNSSESQWVKQEISAARIRELEEQKIVILPLLYEDCTIPTSLSSKLYADFRGSFQGGFDQLIRSLREHEQRLGSVGTPPPLPPQDQEATFDHKLRRLTDTINGSEDLYMVMDLGGTKAYVSLVNGEAERFFDRKYSTESHENADNLLAFIKGCIRETLDAIHEYTGIGTPQIQNKVKALGIAFPGPTDCERGLILDAANFQIQNFPLASKLEQTFNIPTFVDNDVNLGVLGESWKGVAKEYLDVVGIIIGTGIGGGVMIDGHIYRGKNKTAGEIGHLILDIDSQEECGCGQLGCFESLASRKAMGRDLHRRKLNKGDVSLIWEERNLGSNEIADHFKSGDPDAMEVVNTAAKVCGKAVFSILNLLNPAIIFFAGGFVRQLGDVFLEPVRAEAKKCMNAVYSMGAKDIPIKIGSLDNPILVGACKMIIDGTKGAKEHSKRKILESIIEDLNEADYVLLRAFYHTGKPILISKDPKNDFFEERLRKLRNAGLIQSVGNQSFRKSRHVQITKLGKIIVEEKCE